MAPTTKIRPLEAALLAVLFAASITLPLVKQLTIGDPDTSAFEKRDLAPKPDYSGGGLRWRISFLPRQIDAWYSDHFGFRSLLVEAGSLIDSKLLHISRHAVVGKNGWLFYKLTPPLFAQSFNQKDLGNWKTYLEHRQRWLAARGIKYLFLALPDKESIYPEFLPATLGHTPRELPVDELIRYLQETHSTVDVLSLKDPLLAAKKQEKEFLYYREDGHWNSLGGFYGYQAIIRHLAMSFPALEPKSRANYRLAFAPDGRRDIALQAGLLDFPAHAAYGAGCSLILPFSHYSQ